MLNLQSSYAIAALIANLFAYFITVSLTGYFKAWSALKAGDDTAERMGLLTFNPMVHMSTLGLIFLPFFGWGFGRWVWINPHNITSRLRLYLAYAARPLGHIVLALLALMGLILSFGSSALAAFISSCHGIKALLPTFLKLYSSSSSLLLSIGLILLALIVINVILAQLQVIHSAIDIILYETGHDLLFNSSTVFLRMLLAIGGIILLGPFIWCAVMRFLWIGGALFGTMIGV